MILPPITVKQKNILLLLYKFRYLNTNQIQKILNHKNPTRIQQWLKDLVDKEYIQRHFERKTFKDNTHPAVYYLTTRARHILKKEKDCNLNELNRIYKEKKNGRPFIDRCMYIADLYIFFHGQKEKDEEMHFLTQANMRTFEYLPDPLPSAYIAIKKDTVTRRYFLDYFEENTPPWVLRQRVKIYLEYQSSNSWEENTNNYPFPSVLFVCPTEIRKKHIYWYGKSVIEKSFAELTLFVTTKKTIQFGTEKGNIWQKVE